MAPATDPATTTSNRHIMHPPDNTVLHRAIAAAILLAVIGTPTRAQYYDEPVEAPGERRFVFAGAGPIDFAPTGSNPGADSTRISFASMMVVGGIRQGPFELLLGYTQYTMAGVSLSGVTVQTTIGFEIPLTGGRSEGLLVPILIAGDYTKAESRGPARSDFNLGSVGAGAGLAYRRSSGTLEFSAEVGQLMQYSFEGFAAVYGFSAASIVRLTLVLPRLPVLDGMAFGYRFRYQSWSMSDKTLNYRMLMHGLSVGLLL